MCSALRFRRRGRWLQVEGRLRPPGTADLTQSCSQGTGPSLETESLQCAGPLGHQGLMGVSEARQRGSSQGGVCRAAQEKGWVLGGPSERGPRGGEVVEGGQLDRAGAGGEGAGAGPGLSTGSGETRGHVMRAGRGAQPAPSSWNAGSLPENDGRQVRGQDWRPWQLRGLWG